MIHTLEADSIQLEFDGRKILSDVYVKIETGKITGLLGRNGAGKSSLMKVIYGTLSCEKSVRLDHVSLPTAYKHPRLLMYLPQFNFIPKSISPKRIFSDFNLDYSFFEKRFPEFQGRYKQPLSAFSGGACRLIELYTVLMSGSRFVMLDEPFTHLSPLQVEQIVKLMNEQKSVTGILATDHLYQSIVDVSDRLYVLANRKTYLAKSIEDIERLNYARP